nr:hypothetical protein [Halovivax asiaticus]
MSTTVSECIDALQRAAAELGQSPTKAQYEALGFTPASATIIRTIGSWNEAKVKANLETYYSRGPRVSPKPDDIDLPDDRDWSSLSVDQRWHYRNREWNTKRTLRRRTRLREWVRDQRQQRGCTRCGMNDPGCLDFHHRKDESKRMNVGEMVTYGYGKDALREEIAKCDVLCANCHRLLHHQEPSCDLRRWKVTQKRKSGGCTRCSEERAACLDYHHTGEDKSMSVSQLVANNRPKGEVRREMKKCVILCANCHRREHYHPSDTALQADRH